MKLQPIRHEDDRRVLTEYISDIPFRRAKVLEVKKKCVLGRHYHNDNDSVFYVLKGKGVVELQSAHSRQAHIKRDWMFEGDCLFVARGIIHTFTLYPGTIMLECATLPFNEKDEIQITK